MKAKIMAHSAHDGTETCNTESRSRLWFGTWNNYPEDGTAQLINMGLEKYVIGKEIAPTTGTSHLQFCIGFKNPKRYGGMKKAFPKVHWETVKDWYACVTYCKKEGDYICYPPEDAEPTLDEQYDKFMEEEYKNVTWKPWQAKALEIISGKVDRRKIHWFWEDKGNVGKSFLARYIEWKFPTVIVNGKQGDVFNGIKGFLETEKKYPNPIIIDIPKTNENYVCYGTMEKIKDGLFYSGKYEGGKVRLLPCHVLVFANFPPDESKMMSERWEIHHVT